MENNMQRAITGAVNDGKDQAALAQKASQAERSATISRSTSNSVNVEKIEVNSNSADPRQVAGHVGDAIGSHLQNAAQHYDDGESH